MRIDLTVYADNAIELGDALAAVRGSLPADLFAKARGFRIIAEPEFEDIMASSALPAAAVEAPLSVAQCEAEANKEPEAPPSPAPRLNIAPSGPEPTKRHRRTKAQIEADNKAAAAGAMDAVGPDATGDTPDKDLLSHGTEPEAAPAGDDDASLSQDDARLKALEVLREAYALTPGGPAAVKVIQKIHNVAKFIEVPVTRGHMLLNQARECLAKLQA